MVFRIFIAFLLSTFIISGCSTKSPRGTEAGYSEVQATPVITKPVVPAAENQGIIEGNPGIADRHDVHAFVLEMSRKHGFSVAELNNAFDGTAIHQSILDSMAKPYEAKPWYAYRKLFLTEKRIQGGIAFEKDNSEALARARRVYGVSPDIITAIIGVESSYGKRPGRYRVMDSLSTLAFAYPRRAEFFRGELEQFLLLCREEGISFLDPVGSYAGAMGMPQFMPSSFRRLAADGDDDGHKDIWHNPADAIASVARYFDKNGWHTGEPIAVPAIVNGPVRGATSKNPKPNRSLSQLAEQGAVPSLKVPNHLKGALLELPGEDGPSYWIVFHNFSVIMRYNHSPLYAMAAYELSREIAKGSGR